MMTIFDDPKEQERSQAIADGPSPGFRDWWCPNSFHPVTGSGMGGHPEAMRKCVNVETKEVAYYGIKVEVAWKTEAYRAEYRQWLKDGQPEREVIDGNCGNLKNIKANFADLRQILKPLFDRCAEAKRGVHPVERAVGEICGATQREPELGSYSQKAISAPQTFREVKQVMEVK